MHRAWEITSGCCFKLLIVWSFVCSNRRRMHVSRMHKSISKSWQPPPKHIQNLMPSLPSYPLPLKLELPAFIVWIIITDCWLVGLLLLSRSNCFFVLFFCKQQSGLSFYNTDYVRPFPCSNPANYGHRLGLTKLLTTSLKALHDLATSNHSDLTSSCFPLASVYNATLSPVS